MRTLYAYEAQRPEELSECHTWSVAWMTELMMILGFGENLILTAHPSKTGGDWWHGTVVRDGKSGFFPKTYVEQVTPGS